MKQLEEQCYYIVFNISANKHLDKIFIARQEAEEYAQALIHKDDKYKIIPLVLLSDAKQAHEEVERENKYHLKMIDACKITLETILEELEAYKKGHITLSPIKLACQTNINVLKDYLLKSQLKEGK